MNFSVGTSSVKKGESLRDTVQTIEAMGVDCIVVRHASAGAPWRVADWVDAAVVNAGDGWHEHPTQALLDSYTIRQHLGARRRQAHRDRRRHQALAGWRAATCSRSPRSAPTSRSSRRPRCCRRASTAGR